MTKTIENCTDPDVIGKALAVRQPRRRQRMAGEVAAPAGAPAAEPSLGAPAAPRTESKIARVISLLKREQGATLAELIKATCWLPHTSRAALTGLRKKGHAIEKTKRDEVTCYRIAEKA